jgi:2,3-bisphosphoglycerate-independent phosphoglycerate mutase
VKPPGYGETQPRLDDDRLPVVLVVLDGLGDRPSPQLGDRTPSEAATTPVLDSLARRGCSGWHLPFGWGQAPASELAHWAMFGFADVPFPGRAVLEALGAGLDVESSMTVAHAALRSSYVEGQRVWITGRAAAADESDAAELIDDLEPVLRHHGATLRPLGSSGEALLSLTGHAAGAITDSDPFFEDFHPWLRVLPRDATAEATAEKVNELLLDARELPTALGRPDDQVGRQQATHP